VTRLLRRFWIASCTAFTLLFLVVTFTPVVDWYALRLAGPWSDPDGDILIVLAGGSLDKGFPSDDTMLRALYALRAYRAGHFRQVVTVGFETGEVMREILGCTGIPAASVVAENTSRSTRENAIAAARLLAGVDGSKILLTSDYHMFRAVRTFRKAGLSVVPYPIPDARKRGAWRSRRWAAFQDEAVETVKIAYYWLRGWI